MSYADDLCKQSEQLFGKRGTLLSLWQTIADNFYPERADFTTVRNVGEEFATQLMTSYPIIARRDLGNAFGAMLRPTSKSWFHMRTNNYDKLSVAGRAWLEWATDKMRHRMNNRRTQFARATTQGDNDYAAFGQCVLQVSHNADASDLLYRCWHLRDCAWIEDANGMATTVVRKWKPTADQLVTLFPGKVHKEVTKAIEKKDRYKEFETHHIIMPIAAYRGEQKHKTPFVSIYFDAENKHIIEERGLMSQEYIIPRWSTVSGTQYAYSPATVAALPDGRLIQAMTRVLLDAGEKAVTPPMIAVQDAIRSDVNTYAGGMTWVSREYDERLGEVLRPLTQDKSGLPIGLDMADRIHAMIAEAFYLNKLSLPQPGNEMTAYEVGQRVQEYIRQALPLFQPMETEYNHPLCDATFELMLRSGGFGSPFDMPKELHGADIEFVFESPLHDAVEREKGQRFLEAQSMLAQVIQLDPNTAAIVDAPTALRDVLEAIGVPAKWTRSPEDAQAIIDQNMQDQQSAQLLAQMQQGADVAKTLNEASAVKGASQTQATSLI